MLRRVLDILVALLGLTASAPLLLVLWLWVRLGSPGPGFYGGRRVGRGGREFRMWKFRSMYVGSDAAGGIITSGEGDCRITSAGAFLRRTKLDELPQLWNLLVGDVTLVGPRPEAPDIVAHYSPEQQRVLEATPGITGRTQIEFSGREAIMAVPEGMSATEFYLQEILPDKIASDLRYLDTRSLLGDLRILGATVGLVLRRLKG
ncbi:MAG: sugar transferase [Planctomycetota bacterium]|jgi:lipopolysaccharide/colanic/teichoic acid biosynthesis glycosyltransferase